MEQALQTLRSEFTHSARELSYLEQKLHTEFSQTVPSKSSHRTTTTAQPSTTIDPLEALERLDRLQKEISLLKQKFKAVADAKMQISLQMREKLALNASILDEILAGQQGDPEADVAGSRECFDRLAGRVLASS
ncbi:hypothetical protein HDV00_001955 [Rhizophlyctis rosea]|nr:hypothetical protein HDV00_001955 [Rhizophlyctis rosea]